MSSAKRYIVVAGSFAIALTLFTTFSPRAVHAITATLVQVVNNSATPVPNVPSPLRFETTECLILGPVSTASNYCGSTQANTFTVPMTASTGATVKRLIVDNVSGFCANFDNPAFVEKFVTLRGSIIPDAVPNTDSAFTHYVPLGPPYSYVNNANAGVLSNHPESDYAFGQVTNFAFNAGDTVTVGSQGFFPGTGTVDRVCSVRIEGYLVPQ